MKSRRLLLSRHRQNIRHTHDVLPRQATRSKTWTRTSSRNQSVSSGRITMLVRTAAPRTRSTTPMTRRPIPSKGVDSIMCFVNQQPVWGLDRAWRGSGHVLHRCLSSACRAGCVTRWRPGLQTSPKEKECKIRQAWGATEVSIQERFLCTFDRYCRSFVHKYRTIRNSAILPVSLPAEVEVYSLTRPGGSLIRKAVVVGSRVQTTCTVDDVDLHVVCVK